MKKRYILFILCFVIFLANVNTVKATDELIDDGARISSAQVIQTKTGTGPFDDNDEPGNDSSEDNNIVRSFDQVTWTIENTMILNNSETTGYTGGRIYFEATLPDVFTSETANWNLDSMGWIEGATISSDGLTLSGYYEMSSENITVPGKQSLVFVANILGAVNGTEFSPEIKLWLNGNIEEEKLTVNLENITISAAPNYNIKLVRNSNCASRTTVEIDEKNVTGRMYGYAIIYQLYNQSVDKGLKGIEYPTGDITLDLEMKLNKKDSQGNTYTDITSESTPILWNYQLACSGTKGLISGRNMYTGSSHFVYMGDKAFPYGKATSDRKCSVFNSGKVVINQESNILNVNLNGYEFDGTFPIYNRGYIATSSIAYTGNIGCFGSIYLQILVPDWDEYDKDTDYYLTVTEKNFHATSLGGSEITVQQNNKDDSSNVQYTKLLPGNYNSLVYIYKRNGNNYSSQLHSLWSSGDGIAVKGQELYLTSIINQSTNNDEENHPRSVNSFLKFDGDCFKPVVLSNGSKFRLTSNGTMTFRIWYVTKKDGSNWESQEEMNNTIISECELYENLSDIPEDKLCIGAYFESQGGEDVSRDMFILLPVVIKDSAKIGKTYGITQKVQYYTYELDRNIYTAINEEVVWPDDYVYYPTRNYVKTEYDDQGVQISGTHAGGTYYGNTVKVVGAEQKVEISPIDDSGNLKVNYDFSKNEYNVKFKVSPILSSSSSEKIEGITIKTTITLPSGLTYVPNSSNSGEPEITNNSNGTTTLIFYIDNCVVNENIDNIVFQANINEESLNGEQYNVKAVVYADPDKVGTQKEDDRKSETSIQIINLSSHRLYKMDTTPVIEKNGEIHYTLSYKNNTDETIPDFQLLDILPYNGDGRGTGYTGSYTLDRLVVTQEDSSGNVLSNDNLSILYTADESIRDTVTSKDESLGEAWTQAFAEDINQKATALVVKGEVGSQGKVTVDIYLKTSNNKGLDKYVNSATAQVYKETEEMTTSNVVSQVVERKIEGIAWKDENANGIKDEEEQVFSNIDITLTDNLGQQVTDVNGNVVSSVKTDENGYYKFENLPKGIYYVKVNMPNNKYTLTEKEIGANNEINSKFKVEERETDEITKLNSLDLPELTVSYVNAGLVKKETKVVVNYKEIGTEKILHNEIEIFGRIDDEYETEDKIEEINKNNENKYEYVRVEGNTTGVMTEETTYITYYYQKKEANVKVLHILEGTDVNNPESVTDVLYPTEEIKGRVDDSYTTKNRLEEINNLSEIEYELVEDEVINKNGYMEVDTIYVVYEYRTIPSKIKIEHKDIDSKEDLVTVETKEGVVGEKYTTQNKLENINITYDNKYELVSEPENKDGKYKREEQTITYYYQKKIGEVEVNYLEIGTEKVLAEQEVKQEKVDSQYVTENKLSEINEANNNKYEFVKTTGDATEGIYKLAKQVVNYYYQKKETNIKVLHVEEGTDVSNPESVTDVLYPTEEIKGRVDDSYTTQNRVKEINDNSVEQYELISTTENASGNMTVNTQYVIYVYKKMPSKIKIKHVDKITDKELLETEIREDYVGKNYETENRLDEINEKYEDNYILVSEPDNKNGVYKEKEQVIVYYYEKKATKVIVKYLDIETDEELYREITKLGKIDDKYISEDKIEEINKSKDNEYVLVKTTENTEGLMTKDIIEVIYYYKKVESKVIVKYVDIATGEEIEKSKEENGYVGNEYITEPKEIENYDYVYCDGEEKGIYEKKEKEVIYYYMKTQVKAEEKPDDGNIDSSTQEINNKIDNIETGDDVNKIVIIVLLSIIGIVYICKNIKKGSNG